MHFVFADQFDSRNYHLCIAKGPKNPFLMDAHKENYRSDKNVSELLILDNGIFPLGGNQLFCQENLRE